MSINNEAELELPPIPVSEKGLSSWLQKLSLFLQAGYETTDSESDMAIQQAEELDEPVRRTFQRADKLIKESNYRNG